MQGKLQRSAQVQSPFAVALTKLAVLRGFEGVFEGVFEGIVGPRGAAGLLLEANDDGVVLVVAAEALRLVLFAQVRTTLLLVAFDAQPRPRVRHVDADHQTGADRRRRRRGRRCRRWRRWSVAGGGADDDDASGHRRVVDAGRCRRSAQLLTHLYVAATKTR